MYVNPIRVNAIFLALVASAHDPMLQLSSQGLYLAVDQNNPPPASYLEQAAEEEKFRDDYLNRTGINHF